jgi:hypothetical protein
VDAAVGSAAQLSEVDSGTAYKNVAVGNPYTPRQSPDIAPGPQDTAPMDCEHDAPDGMIAGNNKTKPAFGERAPIIPFSCETRTPALALAEQLAAESCTSRSNVALPIIDMVQTSVLAHHAAFDGLSS